MPITVAGTQITFNDLTTQNTAAVINTTNILNATAGASLGAVGTYAFLSLPSFSGTTLVAGTTYAGSTLRYAGGASFDTNNNVSGISATAPAGTWRAMGFAQGTASPASQFGTLCLRTV